MSSPEEFDILYPQARSQLLLETFALTGDLTAARSAVRDGFVILEHHWRKANRLGDPVGWMREATWDRAQRHHQIHVWQRDPQLPEDVRSVLAALSVLPLPQRKAVVATHLAGLEGDELTRLVGLPAHGTEEALAKGLADLATLLDVPEASVPEHLDLLRETTAQVTWPRPAMLRRAGVARRRSHSIIGVVAAGSVLLLGGTLVSVGSHERVNLDAERITATPSAPAEQTALLDDAQLLQLNEVTPVASKLTWNLAETTDNAGTTAILAPCMQDRFADRWAGIDGTVRRFTGTGRGGQKASVTQFVELSHSVETARKTYQRVLEWYGSCTEPRFQLKSTHTITGVGAEAVQFRFLDWNTPGSDVRVNVARTGRMTMTTVDQMTGVKKPGTAQNSAQVLAVAVDRQCASDVATECAITPTLTPIAPLRVGTPYGMLKEVDMPPVAKAPGPWAGTKAAPVTSVASVSRCTQVRYDNPAFLRAASRTFVFPEMKEASSTFGLTQAVAVAKPRKAASFVQDFVTRLDDCTAEAKGTTAKQLKRSSSGGTELGVWHLTVELTDEKALENLVAVARRGDRVTQLVFVPDAKHTMSEADFVALATRAAERMEYFPVQTGKPTATTSPSASPSSSPSGSPAPKASSTPAS